MIVLIAQLTDISDAAALPALFGCVAGAVPWLVIGLYIAKSLLA